MFLVSPTLRKAFSGNILLLNSVLIENYVRFPLIVEYLKETLILVHLVECMTYHTHLNDIVTSNLPFW